MFVSYLAGLGGMFLQEIFYLGLLKLLEVRLEWLPILNFLKFAQITHFKPQRYYGLNKSPA